MTTLQKEGSQMINVKTHPTPGTSFEVDVTKDNLLTRCYVCGKEISVNLERFFIPDIHTARFLFVDFANKCRIYPVGKPFFDEGALAI